MDCVGVCVLPTSRSHLQPSRPPPAWSELWPDAPEHGPTPPQPAGCVCSGKLHRPQPRKTATTQSHRVKSSSVIQPENHVYSCFSWALQGHSIPSCSCRLSEELGLGQEHAHGGEMEALLCTLSTQLVQIIYLAVMDDCFSSLF